MKIKKEIPKSEEIKDLNFVELSKFFSPQEMTMIKLILNKQCFTTESIAKFLDIEQQEVREAIINILLSYKNKLDTYIDSAINILTKQQPDDSRKYIK